MSGIKIISIKSLLTHIRKCKYRHKTCLKESTEGKITRGKQHIFKKGDCLQTAESTLHFSSSLFLWSVLLFLLLLRWRSLRLRFALFGRLAFRPRLALFGRAGLRIRRAFGLSLLFCFLVMFLFGSRFLRRGRLVPRRLQNRLRTFFTLLGLWQKTLLLFLHLLLLLLRVLVGLCLFNFGFPGIVDMKLKVN